MKRVELNVRTTAADYVIMRLKEQGVDTLFGVVGVPCAAVFAAAARQGFATVVNASDLEAGYAADGYGKLRGLAAVSVSYGVGTLSLANAVAGSYVERSPVVILNGGPSAVNWWNQERYGVLYSHSTGRGHTDLEVFEKITGLAIRIDQIGDVPAEVDRALTFAITSKRPVYIEVSKDLWELECPAPQDPLPLEPRITGAEAVLAARILEMVGQAKAPAFLLGEEVQRYRLAGRVANLLGNLDVRWATTLLAKSVLPEQTPGFTGVYAGNSSPMAVKDLIEKADCLVALGCVFSTGNTSVVRSQYGRMVHVVDGYVRIGERVLERADIAALAAELERLSAESSTAVISRPVAEDAERNETAVEVASAEAGLTHDRLFEIVNVFLDDSWLVVPDTFLGIYLAADLDVVGQDAFLSNAVWASIGHSVAAAVGAAFAGKRRPLVLCGDGGFQMTAQALSTMARYKQRSVVVVVDNQLFGIEQYLLAPGYFNDPAQAALPYVTLNQWSYTEFAQALGVQYTRAVDTEEELCSALEAARAWDGPGLIAVSVKPRDLPQELRP